MKKLNKVVTKSPKGTVISASKDNNGIQSEQSTVKKMKAHLSKKGGYGR